jgi:hypothetical protein
MPSVHKNRDYACIPQNPVTIPQADQGMTGHHSTIREPAFDSNFYANEQTSLAYRNATTVAQPHPFHQSMTTTYIGHQGPIQEPGFNFAQAPLAGIQAPPMYLARPVTPVHQLTPAYEGHTRPYTNWNTTVTSNALAQHTQPHTYPYVHPQLYPPSPRSVASASIDSALSQSTSLKDSPLRKIQFWRNDPVLALIELPVIEKFLLSTFVFSMHDYTQISKELGALLLESAIMEYKVQNPRNRPLCTFSLIVNHR